MIQYKVFASIDSEVQLRRFGLDTRASFNGLKATVAKAFQRELNGRDFQLFWKDDEGDFIKISTDSELQSLTNIISSTVRLYMKLIPELVHGTPKMGAWSQHKQQHPFQPRGSNTFNPSHTNRANQRQVLTGLLKPSTCWTSRVTDTPVYMSRSGYPARHTSCPANPCSRRQTSGNHPLQVLDFLCRLINPENNSQLHYDEGDDTGEKHKTVNECSPEAKEKVEECEDKAHKQEEVEINPFQLFEDFLKALGSTRNNSGASEKKDDYNIHGDKRKPERVTKADDESSEMHSTSKVTEVTTGDECPVESQTDSETAMHDRRHSDVEMEKDVSDEQRSPKSSESVVEESFVLIPEVESPSFEAEESISPAQTENQTSDEQTDIRTGTPPPNYDRVASKLHPSTRIDPTEAEEIVTTLQKLKSMGFSNDGGWLTSLVVNKHGVLDDVISALRPSVH